MKVVGYARVSRAMEDYTSLAKGEVLAAPTARLDLGWHRGGRRRLLPDPDRAEAVRVRMLHDVLGIWGAL